MIPGLDEDVADADAVAERRDEVVADVTEHANRVARELSLLEGSDYGQRTFDTDQGSWTLKYEAGAVQYLRYEDTETYVVSQQSDPEPAALADAMEAYPAFVAAFNEHVRSLEGVLDDVTVDAPPVADTQSVVAERDRILGEIREHADAMAGELHRYRETNYGTFSARVDGKRWELKWEDGRASYLRVGGEAGVYLISQYEPPAPKDIRAHAGSFAAFVEAFNEEISEVSDSLSTVEL